MEKSGSRSAVRISCDRRGETSAASSLPPHRDQSTATHTAGSMPTPTLSLLTLLHTPVGLFPEKKLVSANPFSSPMLVYSRRKSVRLRWGKCDRRIKCQVRRARSQRCLSAKQFKSYLDGMWDVGMLADLSPSRNRCKCYISYFQGFIDCIPCFH